MTGAVLFDAMSAKVSQQRVQTARETQPVGNGINVAAELLEDILEEGGMVVTNNLTAACVCLCV